MSADEPVDAHDAALLAWLARQRAVLAPTSPGALRERAGQVVGERPRKDREFEELAIDMTDDVTD